MTSEILNEKMIYQVDPLKNLNAKYFIDTAGGLWLPLEPMKIGKKWFLWERSQNGSKKFIELKICNDDFGFHLGDFQTIGINEKGLSGLGIGRELTRLVRNAQIHDDVEQILNDYSDTDLADRLKAEDNSDKLFIDLKTADTVKHEILNPDFSHIEDLIEQKFNTENLSNGAKTMIKIAAQAGYELGRRDLAETVEEIIKREV